MKNSSGFQKGVHNAWQRSLCRALTTGKDGWKFGEATLGAGELWEKLDEIVKKRPLVRRSAGISTLANGFGCVACGVRRSSVSFSAARSLLAIYGTPDDRRAVDDSLKYYGT